MPQEDPSRTEKATPKQRNKARDEGNVPKGQELSKTLVLLCGLIFLRYFIPILYANMREIFHYFYSENLVLTLDPSTVYEFFLWSVRKLTIMVLPFLIAIAFVAFLVTRLQVGALWTTKQLKPKFGKLFNILGGIKKLMFSVTAFVRLARQLLQAVAVAIAPIIVIKQEFPNLLPLFYQTPEAVAATLLMLGYKMVTYALVPMVIIALADLWYTRWDYEEQLKMTKDEVKDERRQMEGDPQIKSQQQQKMMEVMSRRMMQEVPKADVVITNPTHIAVALRYNPLESPAPLVLAKGVNRVAERIKAIARENNVPIREDKPLAQALYKQVEIGETIPEEMYQAVAAILARLDRFRTNRG